jgi:hypothetical protein
MREQGVQIGNPAFDTLLRFHEHRRCIAQRGSKAAATTEKYSANRCFSKKHSDVRIGSRRNHILCAVDCGFRG